MKTKEQIEEKLLKLKVKFDIVFEDMYMSDTKEEFNSIKERFINLHDNKILLDWVLED